MANARGESKHDGFPIRIAAERTGLTTAALRAWERRYGVVAPRRTDGAQRVYSSADIDRLKLIARLGAEGHGIATLARRSTTALQRMVRGIATPASATPSAAPSDDFVVDRMMAQTRAFDSVELRAALMAAILELGAETALERVISPFLTRIGEEWACGDASVANEHLASAVVRDVLGWLLQNATPDASAPTAVAATIAGESHEFGTMMAAVIAARAGWRVVYLGANIPAVDLAQAARTLRARLVMLGVVNEGAGCDVRGETAALRAAVGGRLQIVAGGAATGNNLLSLRRARIDMLESRERLSAVLASIWTRSTAA